MFTHEEIMVLDELEIGTIDEAVEILARNLAGTEDDFVKEFLNELINKIVPLSDEEFCYFSIFRDCLIDTV